MSTTTPAPTDAELQQRCAEIIEWQRTGVLPGNALRAYAALHWAGHFDSLQMAERDTSAQAMEAIARWGAQPAASPAPVVAREPLTDNELARRSRVGAIGTDENGKVVMWPTYYRTQMEDRFKAGWRSAEKHHGITSKEGDPNAD